MKNSDLLRRQKAVAWVLTLTENTRFTPHPYEQHLLERFAQGEIALDDIPSLFAARVHHILYRSRATHPFTQEQLTDLVAHSRPYNTYSDITGLLCYCDGTFVQLLEGPEASVLELYAAICQDPRHEQIETLSDAAGSTRWFADWRMALTTPPPTTFYWLISHLEAREQALVQPQFPITDPHLLTLLQAFSRL
ncbi:BLUF domain-containing protein [Hymenobacter tibetensis]|uniref:BLUF domain-containing protein n=1 Tax=Hymenobacter tibetensis TaxID=497967 RepID=A0ABY4D024_9BACT|nr:BLUF domain-containing protein [Hymenobacter tibetensis]UOG74564.1 BLUF domain-containing protein [Hymenobacter tibetensis]